MTSARLPAVETLRVTVLLRALAATALGVGLLSTTTPAVADTARLSSSPVRTAAVRLAPPTANPLATARFAVDPHSAAAAEARDARARGDRATATALDVIVRSPQASWFGDWTPSPTAEVARQATAAAQAGTVPVFVLYAIPHRDCGLYSGGGLSAAAYRSWVRAFAKGLSGRKAVVVVEPDAVALLPCLTPARQDERLALLKDALAVLKGTRAVSYLDGGHANWVPAEVMADRLVKAGVGQARGVALNVSGFGTTAANTAYARALASRLPGLKAVVDTSRNGLGPTADAAWCNPPGRALGTSSRPVRDAVVDAVLWVKRPGESDGECGRGEPAAGRFWSAYAVGLVTRSR